MNEKVSFLFLNHLVSEQHTRSWAGFFLGAEHEISTVVYLMPALTMNQITSLKITPMNIMRWAHGSSIWDKGGYWFKLLNFSVLRFQMWPMKQPPTSAQNYNIDMCKPWCCLFCHAVGRERPDHQHREEQSRYRAPRWLVAFISCFQVFHEAHHFHVLSLFSYNNPPFFFCNLA